MKKTTLFLLSILLLISGLAYGQQNQLLPFSFTFTGRWNPSEDPLLLEDMGLQDIQNVRKAGKHFKGVSGHTAINTSSLSTYPYILNGFHFKKDYPAESHIITYAADAFTPTAGRLYQNTTAIPAAGNFSATALYTPTTFTNMWRFSSAPNGNMIASNGDINLIWGGSEQPATSFVTSSAVVALETTNQQDYSEVLSKNLTTNNVIIRSPTDSYTKLLLHMNGADASTTFTDSSTSTHAMTAVADAQIDTSYFKLGTASGWFDGTGDYLTTPDHADWDFGAGDFTISFWHKPYYRYIVVPNGICGQWADDNNYWYVKIKVGIQGSFDPAEWSTAEFKAVSAGVTIADYSAFIFTDPNQWTHYEIARSGSAIKLFVNGVTSTAWSATTPISTGTMPNVAAVLEVGAASNHTASTEGWIDEFIIRKGIAWHTSDFNPLSAELGTNSSNYILIGSKRPLQGVKFYVGSPNAATSTMTVKEWQGNNWSTLSITDNTAVGGISLNQTGTVTWAESGLASQRFLVNLSLYWYQVYVDNVDASLYYFTVDAPIQQIRNVWSGYTEKPSNVVYDTTSAIKNYTADVGDESSLTFADVSAMGTTLSFYMGFVNPQQALEFYMLAGSESSAVGVCTLAYWNGSAWVNVPQMRDGTLAGGTKTLGQYGVISFSPPTDEQMRTVSGDLTLYYYRYQTVSGLGATTKITEIRGIPKSKDLGSYKFSEVFQNMLFLFNEKSGGQNKAIYSDYNAPDIYNGTSSGEITFGDMTDLTAATVIYNVYMNTAIDQLIVTKANETWRLSGSEPKEWSVQRMSANIGCVAPLSMISAEVTESSAEVKRTVAIWQYDKGIVMSDGAVIVPISDDIKCYWDPNDARYIPTTMQSRSVAWYDTANQSYKLLIASGSTATYLNLELEYSLKYKEWTKIYRENAAGANPLQSGFKAYDTNGLTYTYGGGKDGIMYRLENGNTWNAVANISQYLHTKDLILDNERPMFRKSTVKHVRTLYKKKAAAMGNLTITHYGDQVASVTGTAGKFAPAAITTVPTTLYNTQAVTLGPALYHSFKFSQTTNVVDGMELLGFGVYYEPITTFRQ